MITAFNGLPFSRVFTQPKDRPPDQWRISLSGVKGQPAEAETTCAVTHACEALGIPVTQRASGSAANCNFYHIEARFLDGGLKGMTGNYWVGSRGVSVRGPKAALLIALELNLKVSPAWRRRHGLETASLETLVLELKGAGQTPAPASGH